MFRFIGVKELDIVCLVSPFLIGPGKLTQQYILLLDAVQFGPHIEFTATIAAPIQYARQTMKDAEAACGLL